MKLRRDDQATTEVIGFVLSFALSAMFLLIALNAFWTARNNTDVMVSAVELRSIADRVATRVVEAHLIGQEFSNATVELAFTVPQTVNGHPYTITAYRDRVEVVADDGTANAESTTFRLDAVPNTDVSGTVRSSNERLVLSYRLIPNTPDPTDDIHDIRLQEAS